MSDDSSSAEEMGWVRNFCRAKGNEFFCEIDREYLLDKFNLTGLGYDVSDAQNAYETIVNSNGCVIF